MNSPHSTTAACLPRARAANVAAGSERGDDSVRGGEGSEEAGEGVLAER
jgi:hypothetical protein